MSNPDTMKDVSAGEWKEATDKFINEGFINSFTELQRQAYAVAKKHGFQEEEGNPLYVPMKLGLIGTEVSEALEAHRIGKDNEIGPELADIVIRTMGLAQSLGIELGKEIIEKHKINTDRTFKHGNKKY